jgi:hypothetical protein
MGILISTFLEYLPILVKAAKSVPEIVGFIQRTQKTLSEDAEWTAADQARFDAQVESITSQEHWRTDEERGK